MVQVDRPDEIAYYAGQGAVPKRLRERSAKPRFGGSSPPRASMKYRFQLSAFSDQQSAGTRMATGTSPVALVFVMTVPPNEAAFLECPFLPMAAS
jgi:hypothetical protein